MVLFTASTSAVACLCIHVSYPPASLQTSQAHEYTAELRVSKHFGQTDPEDRKRLPKAPPTLTFQKE